MKILGQLAELISGIDKEVLPTLKTSLEPILSTLLAQQNNNLDLGQVISYVTQTVQKSTFHVGISGHLGSYDFLEIGIIYFCSRNFEFSHIFFVEKNCALIRFSSQDISVYDDINLNYEAYIEAQSDIKKNIQRVTFFMRIL